MVEIDICEIRLETGILFFIEINRLTPFSNLDGPKKFESINDESTIPNHTETKFNIAKFQNRKFNIATFQDRKFNIATFQDRKFNIATFQDRKLFGSALLYLPLVGDSKPFSNIAANTLILIRDIDTELRSYLSSR